MELKLQPPKKTLDKAFLRQRPLRSEMEGFKTHLKALLDKVNEIESEENQKNHLRDFLLNTYYAGKYEINTKENKDLVIHLGSTNKEAVGVLIETKKPNNKGEMISKTDANRKALHELILYYFDEREQHNNTQQKQLIITNVYEWYIFDANEFDQKIYKNTALKKLYTTYKNDRKTTDFFYAEVKKLIAKNDVKLECAYFDIQEYEKLLISDKKEDTQRLIALFKILSPYHLLKIPVANDSNALNEKFYRELLYIIGLEEHKEGSKTLIRRVEKNRQEGSLMEMTISMLETKNSLRGLPNLSEYGENKNEQLFAIALQLCITWINRLLFLKLLEAQLKDYHNADNSYTFLNIETVNDFDELFKLFHNVLAKTVADRSKTINKKYGKVPYLNSSLFEFNEVENNTITINALDDNAIPITFYSHTKLKTRKKDQKGLQALEYIFAFFNAYDFASETGEDYQEDESHQLINASVLGKVFEKINGYKDGSIYTPGFITMYMCRQAIRPAIVQKFNEAYGWKTEDFSHLQNQLANRKKPKDILADNALINSLHICDPAVGSGHFLVSALNELIVIKHDLGILADDKGKTFGNYTIEIANDELAITDHEGEFFEYTMANGKPAHKESQRLQETLFKEKQTLIENCLFGVDINPNSVKICRLRLWVELLKNAYYKADNYTELETLPNIDINIKCGNSLLSRFALDADLKAAFNQQKFNLQTYKLLVETYHKSRSREEKEELIHLITDIKEKYTQTIYSTDPRRKKLSDIRGQLELAKNAYDLFGQKMNEGKRKLEERRLTLLLEQKQKELDDAESGALYRNAFEWRFEFPEVLNDKGDYIGFDVVIGNPPYISVKEISSAFKIIYSNSFKTAKGQFDIYILFIELSKRLLKSKGLSSMITSNTFLSNKSFKDFRWFLLNETKLLELNNLDESIFENAKLDAAILFYQNIVEQDYGLKVSEDRNSFDKSIFKIIPINIFKSFLDYELKIALTEIDIELFHKFDNDCVSLDNIVNINRGIEFGRNNKEIVQFKEKESLPIIVGGDISQYYIKNITGYCVWRGEKSVFKDIDLFTKPRLLIQRIRNLSLKQRLIGTYADGELLCTNTLRILTLKENYFSLKYLLALINSSLMNYFFRKNFLNKDIYAYQLGQIQIKLLDNQQPFINLVDKILSAKKENPAADTSAWEAEIDQLVYKLYNLTPQEIAIVEGKA